MRRDEVIGDDDMNRVGGPSLRHVTSGAINRRRVPAVPLQPCLPPAMTSRTSLRISQDSVVSTQRLVRIVACGARQRARAGHKTTRLAEPVDSADELEFLIVARAASVIEMQHVIRKRL